MQILKKVFNFYVFSNIHVAFSTFCLTKITLILFDIKTNEIAWFIFFSTLLSYNYIRLYRKSKIKKNWLVDWIDAHEKLLYIVFLISVIGVVFFGLKLTKNTLFALLPLGLVTLFYVLPIGKKVSLRSLSGLKIYLIAFCWAFVTVLLPIINYDVLFSKDIIIIFLQRFLLVLVITIPFDIRDLNFDSDSLNTLPQILGVEKSKKVGLLLLMLFLGLNFLKINFNIQTLRVDLLVALLALLFLVRAKSNQHKYYSAFFGEAVPILWFLVTLIK